MSAKVPPPRPPQPIRAAPKVSLGATYPRPRTWRGTMLKTAGSAAEAARNSRRSGCGVKGASEERTSSVMVKPLGREAGGCAAVVAKIVQEGRSVLAEAVAGLLGFG